MSLTHASTTFDFGDNYDPGPETNDTFEGPYNIPDFAKATDFFVIGDVDLHSGLVSLSGGMDSAVALALAVASFGKDNVSAISYNYGQRHRSELDSAKWLVEHYGIEQYLVLPIPSIILRGFGSPLVEKSVEIENQTYQEMIAAKGMAQTVVPNRNMILLSMATAYAMSRKLDSVWIGAHAEDARNFAYADCTVEFNSAMKEAISIATYQKVHLLVPFQHMSKGEVVKLGLQLNVPFEHTMSCYRGTNPACGLCPTCSERKAAFEYAGTKDPIAYEV